MVGLAFVIAVVAVVLAVVFFLQGQSAAAAVKALREDAGQAHKETEAARAELRHAQEESKTRSAQLAETREKLAETRRKAQEGRSGKSQPRGAREAELEEDLAHARRLTEDAHAAEAQARRELELVKERLAQAERKLWQSGIPLPPPMQKERPRATGPASADRAREEAAQPAQTSLPLEGASPEAIEAGEPIGAEEAEGVATPASGTP